MNRARLQYWLRQVIVSISNRGLGGTLLHGLRKVLLQNEGQVPLSREDPHAIFATDTMEMRSMEIKAMRASSLVVNASHVESSYPFVYSEKDRILRYAFLPALNTPLGLVVYFHGHNANLQLGPMSSMEEFDLLAPWDTFGWNRQGSWFWGEKGENFVERLVMDCVQKQLSAGGYKRWFCMGGSMGGFAALYHGIKRQCNGIYVTAPQIDLQLKVIEYGEMDRNNPYGFLRGDSLDSIPNLLSLAESQDELPPLFLLQRQFDAVNPFAEHAFRLLDIYNKKKGWYGLRVYPSIGHGSDGSQEEAELFFHLLSKKSPPFQFPAKASSTM